MISLSDFLCARRERRRLPDYSVVLTFDDGFQDFATVASDPLIERKMPATAFIITHRASGLLPPNGEAFLAWADVEKLARTGIEFGSHTCSHPRLLYLSLDEVTKELVDSRNAILEHVGQAEVPFSYPHGQTSESLSRLAESLGYSCGITTVLGPNSRDADLFALRRTVIASDDNLATFAARVSGLTWWASSIRRLFRPASLPRRADSTFYPALNGKPYDCTPTNS